MTKSSQRRITWWGALLLLVAGALGLPDRIAADEPPQGALVDVGRLEATARRAGLRIVTGKRLVLVTDRPARDGDGVDDLPRIFDAAFATSVKRMSARAVMIAMVIVLVFGGVVAVFWLGVHAGLRGEAHLEPK